MIQFSSLELRKPAFTRAPTLWGELWRESVYSCALSRSFVAEGLAARVPGLSISSGIERESSIARFRTILLFLSLPFGLPALRSYQQGAANLHKSLGVWGRLRVRFPYLFRSSNDHMKKNDRDWAGARKALS